MTTPKLRAWATKKEAAKHAGGYTEKTIERWIRDGKLPAYRVGRNIRIDLYELDELIVASAVEVES